MVSFIALSRIAEAVVPVDKARIYTIMHNTKGLVRIRAYYDAALALRVYYGLRRGVRAAFRSAGDARPVLPHDFVDRG